MATVVVLRYKDSYVCHVLAPYEKEHWSDRLLKAVIAKAERKIETFDEVMRFMAS